MADEPKKPLPFSSEPPPRQPVRQDPNTMQQHLFELVAYAIREGSETVGFNLPQVTVPDGQGGMVDLGDWRITVARVS